MIKFHDLSPEHQAILLKNSDYLLAYIENFMTRTVDRGHPAHKELHEVYRYGLHKPCNLYVKDSVDEMLCDLGQLLKYK